MYRSLLEQLVADKFWEIAIFVVLLCILVVLILRFLHWRKANLNSDKTIVAAAELQRSADVLLKAAKEHKKTVADSAQFLEGQMSIVNGQVERVGRLALRAAPQQLALQNLHSNPMPVTAAPQLLALSPTAPVKNGVAVGAGGAKHQLTTGPLRPEPRPFKHEPTDALDASVPVVPDRDPRADSLPQSHAPVTDAQWFNTPVGQIGDADVPVQKDTALSPTEVDDSTAVPGSTEDRFVGETDDHEGPVGSALGETEVDPLVEPDGFDPAAVHEPRGTNKGTDFSGEVATVQIKKEWLDGLMHDFEFPDTKTNIEPVSEAPNASSPTE